MQLLLIVLLVVAIAEGGVIYWGYGKLKSAQQVGLEAQREAMQAVKEAATLEGLDFVLIQSMIKQKIAPSVEAVLAAHERGTQQSEILRRSRG